MDRPTNLMVINSVLLFDEPVDWDRVKSVTQERLVDRYPKFRQGVIESRLPCGRRAGRRIRISRSSTTCTIARSRPLGTGPPSRSWSATS
jgi:hypothetical protein